MAVRQGRDKDVEVIFPPGLPGQPDNTCGVGCCYDLEIATRRPSQPLNSPQAPFARDIKTIKNLPIAVDLLTPGHDDPAAAIHGNGRPPNVEPAVRHGDGRVPNLAV